MLASMHRWLLLDTASLYFRAYFGVPSTLRGPNGEPINAAHGLLDMITRLVEQYRPTQLVCAWDDDWRPAWRVALVPSYKTHRLAAGSDAHDGAEDVEDDLASQVPLIRDTLQALGLCVLGAPEAEADDVLGSLARRNSNIGIETVVVTGDRDLFQLIDEHTKVAYVARGVAKHELADDSWLATKYGIIGAQYADFATLRGDSSDGLPGVPGVGEKTAASLLAKHGDLESILAAAKDANSAMAGGVRQKILANQDYLQRAKQVVMTRDLGTLEVVNAELSSLVVDEDELAKSAALGLDGAITRLRAALQDVQHSSGA